MICFNFTNQFFIPSPLWNKTLLILCWWNGRTEYKALCKGDFQIKKEKKNTFFVESWFSSWLRITTHLLNRTEEEKLIPTGENISYFIKDMTGFFNTPEYCVMVTGVCYFPSVLFPSVRGSWLPMQGGFTTCWHYLCHYHTVYTVYISSLHTN